MARLYAYVNPAMMKWTRKSARYSVEQAAAKLKRTSEDLEAWEAGDALPTMVQACAAAKLYRRPLAALYLSEPPKDFAVAMTDFRSLPEGMESGFSPELQAILNVALERQEWARESVEEEGEEPLEWIGSREPGGDPENLGREIRAWLGVSVGDQESPSTTGQALNFWVDRLEDRGCFIFQTGGAPSLTVSVDEMRGMALSDPCAPFIVMNGKDADTGRVFTLLHEAVHLWVGQPGISNIRPFRTVRTPNQRLEVFCNHAAAEALIPSDWFVSSWSASEASVDLRGHVRDLAKDLKVSRESIARRALDRRKIDRGTYLALRRDYTAEWQRSRQQGEGWAEYARMVPKRAGNRLTRMVLASYQAGEIGGRDVSALLNMRLKHLHRVAELVGTPDLGWR